MSLLDPSMFESFRELGLLSKHYGRFQEIWRIYNTNTVEAIRKIRASNTEAERPICLQMLHKIKGSSLNLGLVKLGHFAGAMEADLKANVSVLLDSEMELLERIYHESKVEMEAKVAAETTPPAKGADAAEATSAH